MARGRPRSAECASPASTKLTFPPGDANAREWPRGPEAKQLAFPPGVLLGGAGATKGTSGRPAGFARAFSRLTVGTCHCGRMMPWLRDLIEDNDPCDEGETETHREVEPSTTCVAKRVGAVLGACAPGRRRGPAR